MAHRFHHHYPLDVSAKHSPLKSLPAMPPPPTSASGAEGAASSSSVAASDEDRDERSQQPMDTAPDTPRSKKAAATKKGGVGDIEAALQ